MNMENNRLKGEGDINISDRRKTWNNQLSSKTQALLKEDSDHFLHQSLSTPCLSVLESCDGIYITDIEGRKMIDFHGNNVHQVGYRNRYVIEAVKEELEKLPFSPRRYTNQKTIQLAKVLTDLAPGNLNRVLFAPGATLAVGMALKIARLVTGKYKVLSTWDSFHGASLDSISVGGEAAFRQGMGPLLPGVTHVPPVNCYRGVFGDDEMKYAKYIEYVLEKDGEFGAVILETIRNTDVHIPSKQFYKYIREICTKHGAMLILDETVVALGKTGKMFAFEHYDIVPDMVVIGKGLGGGVIPIAALIAGEHLNVGQSEAVGHYTYEKSPLSSSAALGVIPVRSENLLERSVEMGAYMRSQLELLEEQFSLIGDVRGIGMLLELNW